MIAHRRQKQGNPFSRMAPPGLLDGPQHIIAGDGNVHHGIGTIDLLQQLGCVPPADDDVVCIQMDGLGQLLRRCGDHVHIQSIGAEVVFPNIHDPCFQFRIGYDQQNPQHSLSSFSLQRFFATIIQHNATCNKLRFDFFPLQ